MLGFKKGNETEQVFTDTNGNVMNLVVALMPVRYAVKVQLSIGLCNFLRGHATSHH